MPTKQDSLAPVEQSRQRLLEDQAFKANESYQRMLMLTNNPEVKIQPGAIDALALVEDPTIKARYDQTAHRLHEWGERRMVQHQQQQEPVNTGRGPNTLPSLSLSPGLLKNKLVQQ
ncbi:hypothetical protein PC117_g9128 [Phytophthora cactorum]|uniref:Uncharacterized protein n=1 Tax=Phytophthora cactorum TaxID=29920 RepID=A0A8T1DUD5_9STRA|nr:hypothetical protein PC117_g9128 [Phytophthora cactorum]